MTVIEILHELAAGHGMTIEVHSTHGGLHAECAATRMSVSVPTRAGPADRREQIAILAALSNQFRQRRAAQLSELDQRLKALPGAGDRIALGFPGDDDMRMGRATVAIDGADRFAFPVDVAALLPRFERMTERALAA